VEIMLPETRADFAHAALDGKRLGESRPFQKHVAEFAASIAGVKKETQSPKTLFSFLPGALRRATTTS
jgi:hypothetical protein